MQKVIPILLEEDIKRYAYLIMTEADAILIDPGAKQHTTILIETLKKHIEIANISYVILQSNDYLNVGGFDELLSAGFKGKTIANEIGMPYLKNLLNIHVIKIEDLEYQLSINDQFSLEFIPIPFLPFPEGFVTVCPNKGIVFSAHLFSQCVHKNKTTEDLINACNQFHEQILPSVEFVRQAIKRIRKYSINHIYPRLGYAIEHDKMDEVLQKVTTYDFYNTNQVIEKKNKVNVSYNYEAICNHMLKKLETKFHRADIIDIFNHTEINIKAYPHLEIEHTSLSGYKLWNGFFDMIYQSKGIEWLIILQPVVNKYHRKYNIKLPAIYKTKMVEQQSKILDLNVEKSKLKSEVFELSSKITETTDKLLRCPITGLYNQRFMIGHLQSNLESTLDQDQVSGLILMQIDQLLEINKKYGSAKGDETLKNLTHLIFNVKSEQTLVFKQDGPGIFIYKQNVEEKTLLDFALKLSNEIKSSDLFVENISVSMSITTTKELNDRYGLNERINQFIELTLMRLERAKSKGKGYILDQKTDQNKYVEGSILIVDEDETYQNLMVKIFERIHYQVIISKDVYEAYEHLENHNIDIVISEINLSKLDGFQLKHRMNQSQTMRNIPFIIVSHHKNLEVITRANLLDVHLILQKPIIPEELIGHIKRIREKKAMIS